MAEEKVYFVNPMTPNAEHVLHDRYAKFLPELRRKETWPEMCQRIASVVAPKCFKFSDFPRDDRLQTSLCQTFSQAMESRLIIPNTPTFSGAGTPLGQLAACFVLSISDDLTVLDDSIFETMKNAAAIQQTGGGVGFNFSKIRPKGSTVKSSGGKASGPISFLRAYNHASATVQQGGTRRGANMAILEVSHPDIMEFISCKDKEGDLTYFNISVGITEKFMQCVVENKTWDLIDPSDGEVKQTLQAEEIFRAICEHAWKNGEPGVVFLDRMEADNPNRNLYRIETTNPCVTGDTMVYTEEGLCRIDSVNAGEKIYVGSDHAPRGKFPLLQKCLKVIPREEPKEVMLVTTAQGFSIKATPEHRFWATRGTSGIAEWVEAKDLTRDHRLCMLDDVGSEHVLGGGCNFNMDGYLFGSLLALMCEKDQDPQELLHRTNPGVEWPEFTLTMKRYVRWMIYTLCDIPIDSQIKQTDFLEAISRWNIYQKDNETRYTLLLRSADHTRWGFACASLSLYGGYSEAADKYVVFPKYVSIEYLQVLQQVLLYMGVFSQITGDILTLTMDQVYKMKRKHYFGVVDNLRRQPILDLDRRMYSQEHDCSRNRRNFADVSSVVMLEGKHKVYDLTTESGMFIANGFQVHNCGEQPLGDGESCCLGHLNLPAHFDVASGAMDWKKLQNSIETLTRLLDGMISANKFIPSVPKLAAIAHQTRKIGVGITGLADVLALMGIRYGSRVSLDFASTLMEFVRYHAMSTSVTIASTMEPFKNYASSEWAPNKVTKTAFYEMAMERGKLDWKTLFEKMKVHGIRNSCTVTIAPTGTTSTVLGVEGYGCEPIFALSYTRTLADGTVMPFCSPIANYIIDKAVDAKEITPEQCREFKEMIKNTGQGPEKVQGVPMLENLFNSTCERVSPMEHIDMQNALQIWVDSSISKTINCPFETSVEDVKGMLLYAYQRSRVKGMTVYRNGSRREQVLQVAKKKEEDGAIRQREGALDAKMYKCETVFGTVFVTISQDKDGEPYDIFVNCGKCGTDVAAHCEGLGRLASNFIRVESKLTPTERLEMVYKQLEGIGGSRPTKGSGHRSISSLPDAIAYCIAEHLKLDTEKVEFEVVSPKMSHELCPQCHNASLVRTEGCKKCTNCGYNACS
jgi:ribonucleoside-diphosphate reductase alpha chain